METIPLGKGLFAIVDDEDYEELSKFTWSALLNNSHSHYAISLSKADGKKKITRMHRLIMKPADGLMIDHINGDTLDNRKCNLRVCTRSENSRNRKPTINATSKYKGVSKFKNKWLAQIEFQKKRYFVGTFFEEETAAMAFKVYNCL